MKRFQSLVDIFPLERWNYCLYNALFLWLSKASEYEARYWLLVVTFLHYVLYPGLKAVFESSVWKALMFVLFIYCVFSLIMSANERVVTDREKERKSWRGEESVSDQMKRVLVKRFPVAVTLLQEHVTEYLISRHLCFQLNLQHCLQRATWWQGETELFPFHICKHCKSVSLLVERLGYWGIWPS